MYLRWDIISSAIISPILESINPISILIPSFIYQLGILLNKIF